MSRRAVLHVVPHTHWDREWYEPFQTFRMRLVELVDQLLEQMDEDPLFRFTLDGQLATVDDYLEVRPEEEPRVRRLVAEGRLAVGPWQILMDEFLVSAETIVRNLELGLRRAEALGRAMPVGYLPDMFGHIAQMPQLLVRAGLRDAVVWRGVPAAIEGNAFLWRAPDGSQVRAEYLVGGYGNGVGLFAVPERLAEQLAAYGGAMRSWYGDRSILAMYGTDHAVPIRDLTTRVAEVNDGDGRYELRLETLDAYLTAARAADRTGLPVWEGELRSAARANMLMGVTSARVDLKQATGRAERWLGRYAEPLTALHGPLWPARLFELAWRRLIDCSAHDSVCGCSVDPVVAQVISRLAEAEQIARGVADRAVRRVAGELPRGGWVALNPSPFERNGLLEMDLPIPVEWPAVALELPDGRRVATQEVGRNRPTLHESRLAGRAVGGFLERRMHGREIFGRALNGYRSATVRGIHELILLVDDEEAPAILGVDELRRDIERTVLADPDEPWRVRVVASPRRVVAAVVPVPALGWTMLRPVGQSETVAAPVRVARRRLSNEHLDVRVEADGTLRVAAGDLVIDGVARLVDGGDHGDSYNYGPPAHDRLVDAPAAAVRVETVARGPLRGVLAVRRAYDWPAGLMKDGRRRSRRTIRHDVTTLIELRAGEPFVRLTFEFENRAEDHRLRVHVPLAARAERAAAAGSFAVVTRDNEVEGGHGEVPLPTYPAQEWVDAGGVALLFEHVAEYELVESRELAVTVLRAVGLISRNDNPYREEPAGPERAVPDGQCKRPWRFSFAVLLHGGGWAEARVAEQAEAFRFPFVGAPTRSRAPAARPPRGEGLYVHGPGVALAALRRRGEWLEARLVRMAPTPGEASLGPAVTEARDADLLGGPGAALPVRNGIVRLELGAWEIRTVQLRR